MEQHSLHSYSKFRAPTPDEVNSISKPFMKSMRGVVRMQRVGFVFCFVVCSCMYLNVLLPINVLPAKVVYVLLSVGFTFACVSLMKHIHRNECIIRRVASGDFRLLDVTVCSVAHGGDPHSFWVYVQSGEEWFSDRLRVGVEEYNNFKNGVKENMVVVRVNPDVYEIWTDRMVGRTLWN